MEVDWKHLAQKRIAELSSAMNLVPKLENIVNKEEPTLEDILEVCSHDSRLLKKLMRRTGIDGSKEDFAKEVLFRKGVYFLKSLAIRTMNQEIFEVPMPNSDLTPQRLKKRSVILARFIKVFVASLSEGGDNAYLCGLFYNFDYICYELIFNEVGEDAPIFDENLEFYGELASGAVGSLGFDPFVCNTLAESKKELRATKHPIAQALLRIANEALVNTEKTSSMLGRSTKFDQKLVDATGFPSSKILTVLKAVSRNYRT
tara:strand:+ start:2244 stop:3020 length:777 start_codon:yes stop_codon:yes gene_type:complete